MQATTRSNGLTRLGAIALSATLLSACTAGSSTALADGGRAESAQVTSLGPNESIDAVIRRHYPEGLPYARIRRAGPAALARLRAILNDPAENEWWPNAVGAIGIIGGPDASAALIGFIQAHSERALEPDTYRAALTAVAALGYVAHGGDARAMGFVADAARRVNAPSAPARDLRLAPSAIGVQAILALGISGRPEARAVLEELQRSGDDAMRQRTAESLQTLEQVAKAGLAAYLNRK